MGDQSPCHQGSCWDGQLYCPLWWGPKTPPPLLLLLPHPQLCSLPSKRTFIAESWLKKTIRSASITGTVIRSRELPRWGTVSALGPGVGKPSVSEWVVLLCLQHPRRLGHSCFKSLDKERSVQLQRKTGINLELIIQELKKKTKLFKTGFFSWP